MEWNDRFSKVPFRWQGCFVLLHEWILILVGSLGVCGVCLFFLGGREGFKGVDVVDFC